MKPLRIMLVAGEASGDALAAELVLALRPAMLARLGRPVSDLQPLWTALMPEFFGAGGPRMAAAGVELVSDTTAHAVVGLSEVLRHLQTYRRLFRHLLALAETRQPDLIILVDSSGFNLRLAAALRRRIRSHRGSFGNWQPQIVYYVSPQVWASRPGRVGALARDIDLVLSIIPFEPAWYSRRQPDLRVVFVGHPLIDRHRQMLEERDRKPAPSDIPLVLLLPGSRAQELERHLPVMVEAVETLIWKRAVRARLIVPNNQLMRQSRRYTARIPGLETRVGELATSLAETDIALACSGTVTLECALFEVPTVVMYRASWPTYWVARQIVKVEHIAMPNLLAGERIYPELIQGAVTAENTAREALDLIMNADRRAEIQRKLRDVAASLGPPGASQRAADEVLALVEEEVPRLRAGLRHWSGRSLSDRRGSE